MNSFLQAENLHNRSLRLTRNGMPPSGRLTRTLAIADATPISQECQPSLQYSIQMKPIHLRPILCLAVAALAGCQAAPPVSPVGYDLVYPFYASREDARAVAAGQFGAVPVAMPVESDIELVGSVSCKSDIAEVRSRAGRTGWMPIDALPRRLQGLSDCATETAQPQR